jgi:hypothetical protein
LVAIAAFAFVIRRYHQLKLVRLGFWWMLVSIAPTILFHTPHWWEPLSSRYTYLPRIGMIMILASIIHYHISKNTARYVVNTFVLAVLAAVTVQLAIMVRIVTNEYVYVYDTGRTLYAAMSQVRDDAPRRLLVRWDHPFTGNTAHLVAAADTIAGLPESAVIFLSKGAKENLLQGDDLLYWNAKKQTYEVLAKNK